MVVRSDQLDARTAGLGDIFKKVIKPLTKLKPKKKPDMTPATTDPSSSKPDPKTDPKTDSKTDPKKDPKKDPKIGSKDDEAESSTKPTDGSSSKTFDDWKKLYKPRPDDNTGPTGLEPAASSWLEGPLGHSVSDEKFTLFSIESLKKDSKLVDKAVFKAKYSKNGMVLDSMYKDVDMNPKGKQIPTAELMDIGAKKHGSKPKWIYTKKVANDKTRNTLYDGLKEKYPGGKIGEQTWEIKRSSTDPIDKKYFNLVMVGSTPRKYIPSADTS